MPDSKKNFAWPVTSENAVVYNRFKAKLERLETEGRLKNRKIIIFGAGIRGCLLLKLLEGRGFSDIVFCDNNKKKQGNVINQYDILSFDEALRIPNAVFLVAPENAPSIERQLEDHGAVKDSGWYSFDLSVYDSYIKEYCRAVSDHILVMGDCAFTHVALADTITDSLGDMIKCECGESRAKVLAMHGLGQRAHYNVAASLLENGEKPLLLLLLVMEVLTPKAHLMPRTQHPELMRSVYDASGGIKNKDFFEYVNIARERFERLQVEAFAESDDSNKNTANEKLYMKMNYLFKIKEETEGVQYIKKTIKMLNDAGVPVTLYIPPVNYEQGEMFFGEEFKERYYENFTKLYGFLDKEGLRYDIIDASFLLPGADFSAVNTIDETTNFSGRKKIMDFLADSDPLKTFFGRIN